MNASRSRSSAGSTLMQLMVTVAMLALLGGLIYSTLTSGMDLYTKNLWNNTNQSNARNALARLSDDVRKTIAPLALLDLLDDNTDVVSNPNNMAVVSNTTSAAAGVQLQQIAAGPFYVHADAAVGQPTVAVRTGTGGGTPQVGQILLIPSHDVLLPITNVQNGVNSTVKNLQLSENLDSLIDIENSGADSRVTCYIVQRVRYVVQNNQLLVFGARGQSANTAVVVARNVTSAAPFSFPLDTAGQRNLRFLSVALVLQGPGSGAGRYRKEGTLIQTRIGRRSSLNNEQ